MIIFYVDISAEGVITLSINILLLCGSIKISQNKYKKIEIVTVIKFNYLNLYSKTKRYEFLIFKCRSFL